MSETLVTFSAHGRIGRIHFDRPDQGNRMTIAMMRDFIDALRQARDADADVLVIASTGVDFCMGRDNREAPPVGMSQRDSLSLILQANGLLTDYRGVTVAAIRGRAFGFGSGVAAQCDITVVSDSATFGFTEINDGIAPSIVMSYLETYVGRKTALDLVMTGRAVSASEALSMGLVTQVVPDELLEANMEGRVATLLDKPRAALEHCKFYLRKVATVPEEQRPALALDAAVGDSPEP